MRVDMSAKAVTARLKLTSQLRRLCLLLAKAGNDSTGGPKKLEKPQQSK